jgi:hypothetical protein
MLFWTPPFRANPRPYLKRSVGDQTDGMDDWRGVCRNGEGLFTTNYWRLCGCLPEFVEMMKVVVATGTPEKVVVKV